MAHAYEFKIFTSYGALAARIFRDVDDLATAHPTVVITGSWLTVKEQMPDLYTARLANAAGVAQRLQRGQQPSWLYWLTFDGLSGAADVTTPTPLVHSDNCILPDNVRTIAAAMPSADVTRGQENQIDFYDQAARVDFAVAEHLRAYLPATS